MNTSPLTHSPMQPILAVCVNVMVQKILAVCKLNEWCAVAQRETTFSIQKEQGTDGVSLVPVCEPTQKNDLFCELFINCYHHCKTAKLLPQDSYLPH